MMGKLQAALKAIEEEKQAQAAGVGLRVLEIGPNVRGRAGLVPGWEGAQVITLDADPTQAPDILTDAGTVATDHPELVGAFDGLMASHVLEHFSYWRTVDVLKGWAQLVKPGGALHLVVPSLEWAARQILSEEPSPALLGHLYAGQMNQWDLHLCGFTMRKLRADCERAGLAVVQARSGPYVLLISGVEHTAQQHYVKALVRPAEGKGNG